VTEKVRSEDAISGDTLRDGAAGTRAQSQPALPVVDRGHYTVDKELARGGMGRIVTARDRRLDRVVAVKEMLAGDSVAAARFAREVKLTARLQHPGIVSIYEAGRWDGDVPFYAMRLVDGRPLHDEIGLARTTAQRLALLPKLLAVAEAIAYAHGQRIIHRDLKPHNILIGTYGETVVIDWGLAKDLDDGEADSLPGIIRGGSASADSTAITVFGAVMGTPAYMALEQATGGKVDERADVYAIGAMMYQLLAHRPPYLGATGDKLLDALVAGPPPPLARVAPEIPADVVAIVERAMARDLAVRYRTAKELAEDLGRYLTGQLVRSHAYTTGELMRRWLRRHRGPVAVAAVAAVALGAVGVASYVRVVDEKARADDERDAATRALGDAQRAQAAMLLDRARQMVVAGAPARAAPLLAAAYELAGSAAGDAAVTSAVEGQVAAALPASARRRQAVGPGRSSTTDPTGHWRAVATPAALELWDERTGKLAARATGCGSDDDSALDIDFVAASGAVAGVCRALDGGPSRLASWKPGASFTLGEVALGKLHGAVVSDDGRVVVAIEDGVDAPRITRDADNVTVAALPGTRAVAVDPGGRRVAAVTSAGYLQVWDVATARELAVMTTDAAVAQLAFSADGRAVIASRDGGTEDAWSTADLLGPEVIAEVDGTIAALRPTDSGARWAIASPHRVDVFDPSGRVAALDAPAGAVFDAGAALGAAPAAVAAIAHRPSGASVMIATGSAAREVALRDPLPIGATWSDDDRFVFAGGQVIDAATGKLVGDQGSGAVWGCGTPVDDRAACFVDRARSTDGRAATVGLFQVPDGAAIASAAKLPAPATAFAFGKQALIVGGCAGELAVIDVAHGAALPSVRLDQAACVTDLDTSDAGLGAAALASRRVAVWDAASGRVLGSIALERPVEAFALSRHGVLAIATGDGRVGLWDARTRLQVASARVDDGGAVRGVRLAFVEDDELWVTTERKVWRLRWTRPAADDGWRARSPFVRDGMDVRLR
jgi:WD40 repeat protein